MDDLAAKPTIEGARVVLRPVDVDDAEPFLAAMDDAEGQRLTGTHRSFTLHEIREWFGSRGATTDRGTCRSSSGRRAAGWASWRSSTGTPTTARAASASPSPRRAATAATAREATRLVVERVFTDLPVHRIQLEVFAFNPRAQHVYERVGFRREGVLRDALRWDGEYHDTIVMGLLRPDWERSRA